MDTSPEFVSTRRKIRLERGLRARIEASLAARHALSTIPSGPAASMEVHLDTDQLASQIAEALLQHKEQLLSVLSKKVTRKLESAAGGPAPSANEEAQKVRGIHPHRLYSVSFVAERWNVSPDNVRKKSEEELPRSGWKGGEIRYRGIDILRYEGVDVSGLLADNPHETENLPKAEERPVVPQPNQGSSPSEGQADGDAGADGRPYRTDLPDLQGKSASSD